MHWSSWDFALADAINFIKDHTTNQGHLVWEVDDEDKVEVVVESKTDRAEAAVERVQAKIKKPKPGVRHVTRLRLYEWAEDWPTFEEWYEKQNGMVRSDDGEW